LTAFSAAHCAKITKLALSGLKHGNFNAPFAGKSNVISRCRTRSNPD